MSSIIKMGGRWLEWSGSG